MEIDCWDGPRNDGPIVTQYARWDPNRVLSRKQQTDRCSDPSLQSGHTFCTVAAFEDVAIAVADCAFETSELPVMLSLESARLTPEAC
jgi:hypothetical protein|eukprot:7384460-Prymnesium_polylepis.3